MARRTTVFGWAGLLLVAVAGAPADRAEAAGCSAGSFLILDGTMTGTRCRGLYDGESVTTYYEGHHAGLLSPVHLQGEITIQTIGKVEGIEKVGDVVSPTFQGTLIMQASHDGGTGSVAVEELLEGTEHLEGGEVFSGEQTISRERSADGDETYVLAKVGDIVGPTFRGTLSSNVYVENGTITGSTELNGTWRIGRRRFRGRLLIDRVGDRVRIRDLRR